ncbi:hypothetical protein Bca52824_048962 [Brassica carinata]|uniref:Uncharacterized protein n=1 Tax=Brassica carinata TaxID=52824 RepID=A0A8X7RHL8_BRACI|nr:hypothetical protein Bca52824_048962 [Brassica carinata]
MASSAPAVVAPALFDDLHLDRSTQFVVARLLRFWDFRNIKKQGEFMGITLLFLDEQNSVIHGFIPPPLGHYRPGSEVVPSPKFQALRLLDALTCTRSQTILS